LKLVQELLRPASSKRTLDTYSQAQMKNKRRAQSRIVIKLHKPAMRSKKLEREKLGGARRGNARGFKSCLG
jgi:hypothetical protein